jgi:hypothetical protein
VINPLKQTASEFVCAINEQPGKPILTPVSVYPHMDELSDSLPSNQSACKIQCRGICIAQTSGIFKQKCIKNTKEPLSIKINRELIAYV